MSVPTPHRRRTRVSGRFSQPGAARVLAHVPVPTRANLGLGRFPAPVRCSGVCFRVCFGVLCVVLCVVSVSAASSVGLVLVLAVVFCVRRRRRVPKPFLLGGKRGLGGHVASYTEP